MQEKRLGYLGQGGITCGAIDEPRKSSKAIDERIIINFRDKNVVIARFCDNNVVNAEFCDKNGVFILFIYMYIFLYMFYLFTAFMLYQ